MLRITGETFSCKDCGTAYSKSDIGDNDLWIYHPACGYLLYYPAFVEYNRWGTTTNGDESTVIEIRGFFDPSGAFSPEPWYSYKAAYGILATGRDGEYSASVYDRNEKRLSVAYFDVSDDSQINTREGYKWGAGDEEADIPIKVVVKIPESAAKVVISKGEQEIYVRTLSVSAPQVAFTGLTEGQKLDNLTTLTWEANDADGDELTYRIWYYRGENEMYLVATDLTGTSYDADLTDYPGTDRGWFVILATDGGRTSAGESPKVSVPYKAPDILNYMPDGKQFKVTDLIEIVGKVYDAQDGWLWNVGYEWYVDGRTWNNYGIFYFWHPPYMLAPGMHTITMKVTNSAGLSSSMDFNIEIIEDESDIPENWPKNDITLALRLGYYQPLNRLDSPITRIEFAKMMFSFFSPPDPRPDDWMMPTANIMVEFTDMSNDPTDMDTGYAMSMIVMGLMRPKDGTITYIEELDINYMECEFDPYGTITEREAMETMFMTIELSRTQTVDFVIYEESEFIPKLEEYGMFDESGSFNSYNPDERMSKGLTMVRIAKFCRYLHELDDKDYGIDAGFFDNYYDD